MSIPSDAITKRVMQFLVTRYSQGMGQLVGVDDLTKECELSPDEYRSVFHQFFQMGVFRPASPALLQIDLLVQDYAPRLSHCTLNDLLQFSGARRSRSRFMRLLPAIASAAKKHAPGLTIKAILDFGDRVDDGRLIKAVAVPWFEIVKMIQKDPASIYHIDPWKWEEIIAGAYTQAGFDEVILTPRSGDKGRDVVATKHGIGSVRFFDQVKAYKPGNLVTADEVRAMLGVITGASNVSKGIITTTSEFAPRIATDDFIKPFIPYRLELKPKTDLLTWLDELAAEEAPSPDGDDR